MLLKWFNAREATEVGTALADDFALESVSGSADKRGQGDKLQAQGQELQKLLHRFLRRVEREVRPLKLNLFKRAKLANSFKWRLLEKGVEQPLVDELTQALVLRLASNQGSALPSGKGSGGSKRDVQDLHTRGQALLGRGEYAEARECYQDLVNLDSRDAAARNGLGIALAQLARYDEAEDQFRRAIGLRRGFVEAHFNLAGVLQSRGRLEESELPLRRALKLKPSYVLASVSLAMSLTPLGRLAEARDCYQKVLRAAPRNVQALVGSGQIEAVEGRFAEAEALYRRALEIDPGASYAWAALVWLRKMTPADSGWLKRAEQVAASGLTPLDEATLRFAMGKYCDDVGDYAQAFRSYRRANELHKMRAEPYNPEERTRFVDDMVRVYTREALSRACVSVPDSARAVFVVGMPRSGTSLVEQIIASHPAAKGAGELNFWGRFVHQHETAIRLALLPEPQRKKAALEYLRVLAGYSRDALRVVNKQPLNSDRLGLIHSALPNARMIYLSRDPIDTCLSCYFQQFLPALNFTMDLSELAHYYREHQRLVAHWRNVLPAQTLLEVPYAELVADQETWTRRILDFLGLPWDERCLDFHQTVRPVTTASVWQVRQKIYGTSIERWRNYEKFIKPLLGLRKLES
jgi:tetratricopeptide (TPR) repeat protein